MRALLSLVFLFAAACAAAPAPAGEHPIVIGHGFDIASKAMGAARRINVYSPPGYAEGTERYPVLYLLDGGTEQDFHHISGLAHLAWINGSFAQVIVVGIETKDRRNELVGPTADQELMRQYPTAGQSARFREFIAGEVKPEIERRYRTSGQDALIGESLAGLFVVETLLRQPELFDAYIAASPSLWWDDEALAKEAPGLLAGRRSDAAPMLYLTIGDEGAEMQAGVDKLVAAITAAPGAARVTYEPRHDLQHSTIYHPAAMWALPLVFPAPAAN